MIINITKNIQLTISIVNAEKDAKKGFLVKAHGFTNAAIETSFTSWEIYKTHSNETQTDIISRLANELFNQILIKLQSTKHQDLEDTATIDLINTTLKETLAATIKAEIDKEKDEPLYTMSSSAISIMSRVVASNQQKLLTSKAETEALQTQISLLKQQSQTAQQHLAEKDKLIQALRENSNKQEKLTAESEAKLKSSAQMYTLLQTAHTESKQALEELKQKFDELNQKMKAPAQDLEKLKQVRDDLSDELDSLSLENDELNKKNKIISAEKALLQQQQTETQKESKTLKQELESANSNNQLLLQQQTALKKELEISKHDLVVSTRKLEQLRKKFQKDSGDGSQPTSDETKIKDDNILTLILHLEKAEIEIQELKAKNEQIKSSLKRMRKLQEFHSAFKMAAHKNLLPENPTFVFPKLMGIYQKNQLLTTVASKQLQARAGLMELFQQLKDELAEFYARKMKARASAAAPEPAGVKKSNLTQVLMQQMTSNQKLAYAISSLKYEKDRLMLEWIKLGKAQKKLKAQHAELISQTYTPNRTNLVEKLFDIKPGLNIDLNINILAQNINDNWVYTLQAEITGEKKKLTVNYQIVDNDVSALDHKSDLIDRITNALTPLKLDRKSSESLDHKATVALLSLQTKILEQKYQALQSKPSAARQR